MDIKKKVPIMEAIMKKKDIVGKIFSSNNCGDYLVLEEIDRSNTDLLNSILLTNKENVRVFKIRFLATGYETIVTATSIRLGKIKDKYLPSVASIGYIGDINKRISDPDIFVFYKAWNDMINRCYNTNDEDYYMYGGIGISVDPSWYNFSQFYQDIQLIPGYDNKVLYPSIYQLDKDFKQFNIPKNKRIYSKNTCIWISKFDNIMIMNREHPGSLGYFGVFYEDHSYQTRVNGTVYGRFTIPEAAANLFNYIYPFVRNPYNNILILNNVIQIPFEDLHKYAINKNIYDGSTTIPKGSRIQLCIRSDEASQLEMKI